MITTTNAKVIAKLRAEEKACHAEAARHAKRARSFISKRWFFLACTELIEAEIAHREAEATKRAREVIKPLA
jgi:hypothetical protein